MIASGRFTLSRVPRSAIVAAVVAVVALMARMFGVEHAVPDDLSDTVTRIVDGAVAVATLVTVVRTKWAIDDPQEEHDGGERAAELHDMARIK